MSLCLQGPQIRRAEQRPSSVDTSKRQQLKRSGHSVRKMPRNPPAGIYSSHTPNMVHSCERGERRQSNRGIAFDSESATTESLVCNQYAASLHGLCLTESLISSRETSLRPQSKPTIGYVAPEQFNKKQLRDSRYQFRSPFGIRTVKTQQNESMFWNHPVTSSTYPRNSHKCLHNVNVHLIHKQTQSAVPNSTSG